MCTLNWLLKDEGYEIFFNRDELKTRLPAQGPRNLLINGVNCLSPRDRDANGTWMGVNEFGLTICVLNYYHTINKNDSSAKISRGLLALSLLDCRNTQEALQRLENTKLNHYRSFIIAVFMPGEAPRAFYWNESLGDSWVEEELFAPLSSSSFKSERVIRGRITQFRSLTLEERQDQSILMNFHGSHQPQQNAFSVCMHRPDAQTVSFSHVRVNPDIIEYMYAPGAPCKTELDAPVSLLRVPENDYALAY